MRNRLYGAGLAVLVFVAIHRLRSPAPLPALGIVAGGLLAYLPRGDRRWLTAAALVGLLAGAAVHVYSHVAEGRAESAAEVVTHVAADAGLGLVLGALSLGAGLGLQAWLDRRGVRAAG